MQYLSPNLTKEKDSTGDAGKKKCMFQLFLDNICLFLPQSI